MPTQPPVHELEFLKISLNHAELSSKLSRLNAPNTDIKNYAEFVCVAWFKLGIEHLDEARRVLATGSPRTVFSRAYYAVYNASKAVRYIVKGQVSLKGDDHGQASSLPDDFPDVATWASKITALYENRLRADYDNWTTTNSEYNCNPADSIAQADSFITEARQYLTSKFGLTV